MRSWKFILPLLASSLCFAAQSDRITSPIDSSQMVPLQGDVHGLAQPRSDLGRTDGGQLIRGVTLVFHPSAAQQNDLANLLAAQQDRSSPNYHRWLTPAQFANRFGMTKDDISRVVSWLESQSFTVTSVANSRNQISFDGTVAQIETAFATEIHNYLVDSEIHFANASNPSIPAALAASVLSIGHLHNFTPKPRLKVQSHFTSAQSGDHFLSPGDFATIYHVDLLYSAGIDGTGQKIAIVGQSAVNPTDLSNFRSNAGLTAKAPQFILYPTTSTSTHCSGDEGESDLDLEWSGGVAKNASIIFVYAGLVGKDTCTGNRTYSVWDALQQAVDNKYAPVISTSYGFCESGLGQSFVDTVQGWAQQANLQGQTIMAATGDSGAADCDPNSTDHNDISATGGLAVDVPASIPEVTGMGGNEFFGDAASTATTTYWNATGSSDDISSAISYIPEEGWNDTTFNLANGGTIGASGGGASIYFGKPTWQTGTGVPNDAKRDVPDLSLSASPDHDGYLFCSPTDAQVNPSCTKGFRDSSTKGYLDVVGGTSAAAPTFAAIVALLNQYLGSSGLGNINPTLYKLAASNPSGFHDVTTGNNIVPCTSGTTGCPATVPFQYGFTAGVGYDQVTGLGSVDANALAVAWKATLAPDFQFTAGSLSPSPVPAGQSATATLTITAVAGSTGTVVNFSPSSCTGLPAGATCSFNPASVNFDGINPAATALTISTLANMTLPSAAQTITIAPINSTNTTATVSLSVAATTEKFTIAPTSGSATFSVAAGTTVPVSITVTSQTGFVNAGSSTTALPLNYACSGLPPQSQCTFSPDQSTSATALTVNITTVGPTGSLRPPLGRASRIFYALLLPGMFGLVLAGGSRARGARLVGLIVVLGFSALTLSSCGSSSGQKNPGTTPGSYSLVVTATTGGANPLSNSFMVSLTITP